MKKKISKKEGYKKGKEILEALEENDKEALRKTNYVMYDDIIEFPQPCAFTFKRLKEIIKEGEKNKKKDQLMVGIEIAIKIDESTEQGIELKKIMEKNKGRKFVATKTKVIK